MVKRWNRLLVAFFVLTDSMFGMISFVLAYVLRFDTGLIEAPKGYPPFAQYFAVLPLIGALVPLAFQVQGIYRLRRGRTRVDDFFAVFVGSILTVVLGIVTTLYVQAYYLPDDAKERGAFEVSQLVWGLFLVINVSLTYATRELVQVNFTTSRGRTWTIFGNHWPSRSGGQYESAGYRHIAGETLGYFHQRALEVHGPATPALAMGDFNDEPFDTSLAIHALSTRQRQRVVEGDTPKFWNLGRGDPSMPTHVTHCSAQGYAVGAAMVGPKTCVTGPMTQRLEPRRRTLFL